MELDDKVLKQRGKFSITTTILELLASSQQGMSLTKIMQTGMFNYHRTKRYCAQLFEQGLVEYDANTSHYVITPKGRQVLMLSEQLAADIRQIQHMIAKNSLLPQINELEIEESHLAVTR